MLFKNIVLYPFLIFSSALISSADEPVRRGAEPSIEEELRRHLRKLDRWNLMQLLRVERDVDAKQKKRAEVSSNPDELAILAEDEDRGVRFYVASNRHASLDVQLILAQDREPIVRSGVALALKYDPKGSTFQRQLIERIGLRLAADERPLVRLGLASNQNLPDRVYDAIAKDIDPLVRMQLAENLKTPKMVLERLVRDSVQSVVITTLQHRNLPGVWLEQLSSDPASEIRRAVCQNINTSIIVLEKLSSDSDSSVRKAVAMHSAVGGAILDDLATDSDSTVLMAVVQHPQADRDLLLRFSQFDENLAVRQVARERLIPLLKGEIREDVLERWEAQ
jgi:hypothetical protein